MRAMALALPTGAGTFRDARSEPVHRWFPWIEGFSDELPRAVIERDGPTSIYDPFLGSGTTAVVALDAGIDAAGAEVNPFLRFVTRVKTVVAARLSQLPVEELEARVARLADAAESMTPRTDLLNELFAEADYFEHVALADIGRIKAAIEAESESPLDRDLARLALARVLVDSSNMIRRTDLRRRRPNETNGQGKTVLPRFRSTLQLMVEDLGAMEAGGGRMGAIDTDARIEPAIGDQVHDVCVTSPPYLNGTNYVRNTKLEMWVLDLIAHPDDMREVRSRAVTAGINNVRLGNSAAPLPIRRLNCVLERLEESAYDARIPSLVAGYFHDMSAVLGATTMRLRPGGLIYLDIGDSKFAGVHVPTDKILADVAREKGLDLVDSVKIRDRRSRDGTALSQCLLVLQTPKPRTRSRRRHSAARRLDRMVREHPFRDRPYAARNWGHPWHSMCSYQAKLKPSIAHFLVREFSVPGDVVLDPFSGAGTIPLEACLQGRAGWGNDINPLARRLTTAKTTRARAEAVHRRLDELADWIDAQADGADTGSVSGWGMNGQLGEYFNPRTLAEIVAARKWFLKTKLDPSVSLLWAAAAHILHGNRPYALSRRSHPITPFAPTGPFEYRSFLPRLTDKVERLLAADLGENWVGGRSTNRDVLSLRGPEDVADVIITSPPFFGSTRFHVNNWMRLWFCGWEPERFDSERERFLEYQQARDFTIYERVLASVHSVLRSGGLAVWHLGKSSRFDMATELIRLGDPWFSFEGCSEEDVTSCQTHGVSSQGATRAHQFLLLRAR